MAHYKAADSKREQFRRYLEKSGVLDTLTKGAWLKTNLAVQFGHLKLGEEHLSIYESRHLLKLCV